MALNIKDSEAERLAGEVAALANETKTRAVRNALQERKERLELTSAGRRRDALHRFLAEEAWPQVPEDVRRRPLSCGEREAILGYGPGGV